MCVISKHFLCFGRVEKQSQAGSILHITARSHCFSRAPQRAEPERLLPCSPAHPEVCPSIATLLPLLLWPDDFSTTLISQPNSVDAQAAYLGEAETPQHQEGAAWGRMSPLKKIQPVPKATREWQKLKVPHPCWKPLGCASRPTATRLRTEPVLSPHQR